MRRLLIRPGAIGDCILSFPALAHLRADFTEVWLPSPVVPLVHFADVVRPLSSTGLDLLAVGDLRPSDALVQRLQSFDQIVSWYGSNRPEFREALRSFGVACEFHRALPGSDDTMHATDFFAGQVGAPSGLVARIAVSQTDARNCIVIHPFSGSPRKNWPLASYRLLAGQLPTAVDWCAGPDEILEEADRFDKLAELATWLSAARLYIGNDSGITHLAAALGIPVLALFGPTDSRVWAPRGSNVTVLQSQPIEALSVETVRDTANRLLDL